LQFMLPPPTAEQLVIDVLSVSGWANEKTDAGSSASVVFWLCLMQCEVRLLSLCCDRSDDD